MLIIHSMPLTCHVNAGLQKSNIARIIYTSVIGSSPPVRAPTQHRKAKKPDHQSGFFTSVVLQFFCSDRLTRMWWPSSAGRRRRFNVSLIFIELHVSLRNIKTSIFLNRLKAYVCYVKSEGRAGGK